MVYFSSMCISSRYFYLERCSSMQKISNAFKTESIIRSIIAIVGILTFTISADFGWGFVLGALISKENINLKTKEGWGLLALIISVMLIAIYLLLNVEAIYGYLASTILYFIIRGIITSINNR